MFFLWGGRGLCLVKFFVQFLFLLDFDLDFGLDLVLVWICFDLAFVFVFVLIRFWVWYNQLFFGLGELNFKILVH